MRASAPYVVGGLAVAPRPPEQAMAIRNSLSIIRDRRIVICVVFLSPT